MSSFQVSPKWKFWNDDGWQQSAQPRLNMTDQSKTTINVFSPPIKRIGIKGKTNQLTVLFFSQPSSATCEGSLCPLYHWMPLLTSPTCLAAKHTQESQAWPHKATHQGQTPAAALSWPHLRSAGSHQSWWLLAGQAHTCLISARLSRWKVSK